LTDLDDLLRSGEGQRVEFKSRLPKRDERVAHLLAAMANAGGGLIAVGVDDQGRPLGVGDPASVRDRVEEIARDLLAPRPRLTFQTAVSDAGEVVLIRVAATDVPVEAAFSDGKTVYVRVNDRNVPLAADHRTLVPLSAAHPLSDRLAGLDVQVRERFERARRRSGVFGALDYARRNNVSLRTARRDIRALVGAFLIVETSSGVFEAIDD
jgi:hypothetical protein